MEPPRFLTIEEVVELHRQGIALYGGELGLRDSGLLDSAVSSPQQTFGGDYLYPSLAAMAAAYWFGLVMNHVFVDGNKRVGLRAADVFLALNGLDLTMSEAEAVGLTLRMASHQVGREELVARIEQNTTPL